MHAQHTILIAGPTASGKSALALRMAVEVGGVIINADSMQVYADLRVLTARPGVEDEARVPHRLFGHVDGADAYSAGRYAIEAGRAISAAHQDGAVAIVVGGTGLYFRTLLDGLSPIPAIPAEVRAKWRSAAAQRGAEHLHRELAACDPVMGARLRPADTQRVTRALEVFEATGRSLAEWQAIPSTPIIDPDATEKIYLDADRAELYDRADRRFEAMMAAGALDEVARLAERKLSPELPVMRAVGVPELLAAVRGTTSIEAAVAAAKLATRHYIKRQQTWASRYMVAWNTISTT